MRSTHRPGNTKASRQPGALEQEVLAVLAAASEPLTPAQVQEALDDGLAYTTVMTALSRLHAKGILSRQQVGRAFAYRWLDPPTLAARRMHRLLETGDDRAAVLARFVAELGPEEGRLLQELLADNSDGGT